MGLTLYSLGYFPSEVCPFLCSYRTLSKGAIFFWPSAKFEKYGGFVGATFVIGVYIPVLFHSVLTHECPAGCGLSCLEVAANSYITVLGSPKYAAVRLNISQGFQGIASFAGPMIASRWFFQGKNATTLYTVQWLGSNILRLVSHAQPFTFRVYVAVAALGLFLNILFLCVSTVLMHNVLLILPSSVSVPCRRSVRMP